MAHKKTGYTCFKNLIYLLYRLKIRKGKEPDLNTISRYLHRTTDKAIPHHGEQL